MVNINKVIDSGNKAWYIVIVNDNRSAKRKEDSTMKKRVHAPYVTLKRALAGAGVTYRMVAELIGVSETTVQLKINGYSDFYISEQRKICQKWNINPDIFFEDDVA